MTRIWAVAKTTISQAIRMRIAILFILLLVIILPVLSLAVTGDGTLKGKLQTFITYSMALMNLLLCLLTVIIAGFTLSSDLKSSLLHTVVTKPIRRFELFIGKILGIIVLGLILLGVFGGMIFGLTLMIPKISDAPSFQVEEAEREFFTARAETLPEPFDVEGYVQSIIEQAKQQNDFPSEPRKRLEFVQELTRQVQAQSSSVPPAMSKVWVFENVTPNDPNGSIYLKYKFNAAKPPADELLMGYWVIGDRRGLELGQQVNPYRIGRKDKNKTTYEIEIPAQYVPLDGHLDVVYRNHPSNQTTVIFDQSEMKLLYRSGTFTDNFAKGCLIIFARIMFFAVLGVTLSTWLSFPVVMLVGLVVFFTGMMTGFVVDSFDQFGKLELIFKFLKAVILMFPRFGGETNPGRFLTEARQISWQMLGMVFLELVAIKAVVVGLLGTYIFSKREIAKINV